MPLNLLAEVGFWGLSSRCLTREPRELVPLLQDFFGRERLSVSRIRIWLSACRLSILLEGLPEAQSEQKIEVRGPRATVAYDFNGQLTPAALGFANAQGVESAALFLRKVENEEFLFARKTEKGKPLTEILAPLWDKILRTMPWDGLPWAEGMLLPQPPAWFCALLDDRLPNLSVDGLKAGRETAIREGSSWKRIPLAQASDFPQLMSDLEIHPLPSDRVRFLESQFTSIVDSGASVRRDLARLERVCFEQERPRAFPLPFPAEAFHLPHALLCQLFDESPSFLAIESGKGGFLPRVIGFADQKTPGESEIRKRAEHLEERLREAAQSWTEELKIPLAERVGELRQIPSETGIGTLYDDALKISRIARLLAEKLAPDVSDQLIDRFLLFRTLERATGLYKRYPRLEGEIIPLLAENQGLEPELIKLFKERPGTFFESAVPVFSMPALILHLAKMYQKSRLEKGTAADREAAAAQFLLALQQVQAPLSLLPLDETGTPEAAEPNPQDKVFWREAVVRHLVAAGCEKKKFEWLLTMEALPAIALLQAGKRWSDGPPREIEFFSAIQQRILTITGDRLIPPFQVLTDDSRDVQLAGRLEEIEKILPFDLLARVDALTAIRADLEACLMQVPPVLDEQDPAQAGKLSLLRRITKQLTLLPLPGPATLSRKTASGEAGAV